MNEKKTKKGTWKRVVVVICGVIVVLLLAAYVTGILYFKDKFMEDTTINGMDVSYNTVEEVEAKIQKHLLTYSLTLNERDGDKETISAEEMGLHFVSNGETEKLLKKQCRALWFTRYFKGSTDNFEEDFAYDSDKLEKAVDKLNCFSKTIEVEPTDAELIFEDGKYAIKEETQGKKVRKKKLLTLLDQVINTMESSVSLEENNCYQNPKVTTEDKKLKNQVSHLNHYVNICITYLFGEQKEVLDGNTIKDWVSYDANDTDCKVVIKDGMISNYIAYLADKYDTYEKPRKFRTSDGSYVTVEGGAYGWQLDQVAEVDMLTRMMEWEPHIERIPEFTETAGSFENGDMGDTYIEVDLTKQHLWMYKEGTLIVDSDFVSGTMNKERYTPAGTFQIRFKKSPSVLRSNKPGATYESPVTFWMPFNGNIGLHDSSWRGSYGGSIYVNSGSHGCINLPYKAAKAIYENAEAGYPVICFYRNGEDKQI